MNITHSRSKDREPIVSPEVATLNLAFVTLRGLDDEIRSKIGTRRWESSFEASDELYMSKLFELHQALNSFLDGPHRELPEVVFLAEPRYPKGLVERDPFLSRHEPELDVIYSTIFPQPREYYLPATQERLKLYIGKSNFRPEYDPQSQDFVGVTRLRELEVVSRGDLVQFSCARMEDADPQSLRDSLHVLTEAEIGAVVKGLVVRAPESGSRALEERVSNIESNYRANLERAIEEYLPLVKKRISNVLDAARAISPSAVPHWIRLDEGLWNFQSRRMESRYLNSETLEISKVPIIESKFLWMNRRREDWAQAVVDNRELCAFPYMVNYRIEPHLPAWASAELARLK